MPWFFPPKDPLYLHRAPAALVFMIRKRKSSAFAEEPAWHVCWCQIEKSLWGFVVGWKHFLPASGAGRKRERERTRARVPGPSARLQSALRTPTNIHVNCSLREINISDKLPMPLSGAVMKVCWRGGLENTQITANWLSGVEVQVRGKCVCTDTHAQQGQ